MIGNLIKHFRFSYDYIMWDISYNNLMMLAATVPDYNSKTDDEFPDADDPDVFDFDGDVGKLGNWLNNIGKREN